MTNHLLEFTTAISNLDIINNNITNIFEKKSISVYWKDKNGVYLGANKTFLDAAEVYNEDVLIGKNDRDLAWYQHAPALEKNDQEIMHTDQSKTIIEHVEFLGKGGAFLSHKIPLKTEKGVIGIFGLSFLLDSKPASVSENNDIGLTARQKDCLLLLVKGMSMKQIGYHLKLSARTIEHYVESLKVKLGCHKRSDLITKALSLRMIREQL